MDASKSDSVNHVNKVYINRNFTRAPTSVKPAMMHVNPNYSQQASNVQNTNKIYVNPNFIKVSNNNKVNELPAINMTKVENNDTARLDPSINSNTHNTIADVTRQNNTTSTKNSRYCLIRHNSTKPNPPAAAVLQRESLTYKINKYKTVSLNDIKRKVNNSENPLMSSYKSTNKPSIFPMNRNNMIAIPKRSQLKLINSTKQDSKRLKSLTVVQNKTSQKVTKDRSLKKNNIPCPLFKKYGTCLRMLRGKCDFLHDKKHVSICRRFIKGTCHNKNCLLSHDLTTKKMPTCHFYLQGVCTKEDCPYLHVKLNENTKLCSDFLKGYCDKGSKCLLRHVQPETKLKSTPKSKTKLKNKLRKNKIKDCIITNPNEEKVNSASKQITENEKDDTKDKTIDCRYYQEHSNEQIADNTCEVIKPTRCKLGMLPSFIRL